MQAVQLGSTGIRHKGTTSRPGLPTRVDHVRPVVTLRCCEFFATLRMQILMDELNGSASEHSLDNSLLLSHHFHTLLRAYSILRTLPYPTTDTKYL